MKILVVGHYCHDTILTRQGARHTLGGSAAYVSAVLDAAGADYQVVAKAGPDFLYAGRVFRQPRIVASPTARFVDDYRSGQRKDRAEAVCEPIRPEDLEGSFDAGIACGIVGEVLPETLARLRALTRHCVADAQSVLRSVGPGGEVRLRPLSDDTASQLDWLKASRAEAAVLDVEHLRRQLSGGMVITDGPRGLRLVTRSGDVGVAAVPAAERDPTGAGDCFLAGFTLALASGHDPLRAARFGAICGARAVEQDGVPVLDRDLARLV